MLLKSYTAYSGNGILKHLAKQLFAALFIIGGDFINTYITFFGFNIPSYGLCMAIAVILCGSLIIKKAKKTDIAFEDIIIVIAVSVGASIIGGALLYIAVSYTPAQIYNYIASFNFSFIINSGLVFYGGLAGGIAGALISAKMLGVSIGTLEICVVPYIPLGHAIGRIGCMLAGCCYGFEYNGVFAVSNELLAGTSTHFPIQAAEALANFLIIIILLVYTKKPRPRYSILLFYIFMYSCVRFFSEFFRGDEIRGRLMVFSTSQWISIFFICLCTFYCIFRYKFKRKNSDKNRINTPV